MGLFLGQPRGFLLGMLNFVQSFSLTTEQIRNSSLQLIGIIWGYLWANIIKSKTAMRVIAQAGCEHNPLCLMYIIEGLRLN